MGLVKQTFKNLKYLELSKEKMTNNHSISNLFPICIIFQVDWSVYVAYARAIGLPSVVSIIVLWAAFEGFTVWSNVWLSDWTSDPNLLVCMIEGSS